ncbi:hypothetical protein HMPREF1403_00222, partial [Helicobacter pylori GAM201Ai]
FIVKNKAKTDIFYFIAYLLCYNHNVGGVHGNASFVSNLEQLA